MTNDIGSPELGVGRMRSSLLVGRKIGPVILEAAPASPSHRRGGARARKMRATSGLNFTDSSPSAVLTRFLGSRLRATLDVNGSPEYSMTWSHWDMPSGRWIYRLAASPRRIGDNGFSGWRTPDAHFTEGKSNIERYHGRTPQDPQVNLADQALLTGWPTPNVPNGGRSIAHAEMVGATCYHNGQKVQVGLEAMAKLAGWYSPRTSDDNLSRMSMDASEREYNRPQRGGSLAIQVRHLAGWRSPAACTNNSLRGRGQEPENLAARGRQINLQDQVRLILVDPGMTSESSIVEMTSIAALHPAFSLWLQGYPTRWALCAEAVIPLSRSRRRSSSKRLSSMLNESDDD